MGSKKNFDGVTRRTVENLRRDGSKYLGKKIKGDAFDLEWSHGICLAIRYREKKQRLRVEIVDKNFYVSNPRIWKEVKKILRKAA